MDVSYFPKCSVIACQNAGGLPLPAPAALLTGGGCCPQRPWGSSSLPPYQTVHSGIKASPIVQCNAAQHSTARHSTAQAPHGRDNVANQPNMAMERRPKASFAADCQCSPVMMQQPHYFRGWAQAKVPLAAGSGSAIALSDTTHKSVGREAPLKGMRGAPLHRRETRLAQDYNIATRDG